MLHYTSVTEEISVTVSPVYLDAESNYFLDRFAFAYYVMITNHRRNPVRLLQRYWNIREKDQAPREVEGRGVVGQQPLIHPGESYHYNSFCILNSFEGSMEGNYTMETESGDKFLVEIPKFDLKARVN